MYVSCSWYVNIVITKKHPPHYNSLVMLIVTISRIPTVRSVVVYGFCLHLLIVNANVYSIRCCGGGGGGGGGNCSYIMYRIC